MIGTTSPQALLEAQSRAAFHAQSADRERAREERRRAIEEAHPACTALGINAPAIAAIPDGPATLDAIEVALSALRRAGYWPIAELSSRFPIASTIGELHQLTAGLGMRGATEADIAAGATRLRTLAPLAQRALSELREADARAAAEAREIEALQATLRAPTAAELEDEIPGAGPVLAGLRAAVGSAEGRSLRVDLALRGAPELCRHFVTLRAELRSDRRPGAEALRGALIFVDAELRAGRSVSRDWPALMTREIRWLHEAVIVQRSADTWADLERQYVAHCAELRADLERDLAAAAAAPTTTDAQSEIDRAAQAARALRARTNTPTTKDENR